MKRPIERFCFWVTPAYHWKPDRTVEQRGWRADVHLKQQVDESDGEVAEPLEMGEGQTPIEALTAAVALAVEHDDRDPDVDDEEEEVGEEGQTA